MSKIPLADGRRAFGHDAQAYADARPDYPDALYARLAGRCGLGQGAAVFEVGPGTGLATRRLLALGAGPLHAIEHDPRLAAYLRDVIGSDALEIETAAFEDAVLPPERFDLGVAATAFHWLEQRPALAKARAALKPGGWWAMWWNNFGGEGDDAFQAATDHLFADVPDGPSQGKPGRPPFSLDREARLSDLATAEFEDAEAEVWRWSDVYETARVVALYRTFSPVQALPADRREVFLTSLARIVDEQFGGRVERPFITALYTARRP